MPQSPSAHQCLHDLQLSHSVRSGEEDCKGASCLAAGVFVIARVSRTLNYNHKSLLRVPATAGYPCFCDVRFTVLQCTLMHICCHNSVLHLTTCYGITILGFVF